MLLMVIAALLLLVSETNLAPPLYPTATHAQLRLVGDTDAAANKFAAMPANAHSPRPVRSMRLAAGPLPRLRPRATTLARGSKTGAFTVQTKVETANTADILRMKR